MKKSIIIFSLILLFSILSPYNSKASHFKGGEITWECISSGQDSGKFVFQVKLYRECYTSNGQAASQFPTSLNLMSNPVVGAILLTEVNSWPKDISPNCNSSSNFAHLTCTGMSNGYYNMGATQEHIYRSQPVLLNITLNYGSGVMFYLANCCKNITTNVMGYNGWYLKAMMYPSYNGQNLFPCNDNSPYFAEDVTTVIESGYPYSFSNLAIDIDSDSIKYEWGHPKESYNSSIIYNYGYSYLSPFPSIIQNPNNVNATLDPSNGLISLKSYTIGAFTTSVKVTSYRNGQKLSEIWREIDVIIKGGNSNAPPLVTISADTTIQFDTTVYVGDSLSIIVNGTDFNFLPNGNPQTLELQVVGSQFGDYIPATSSLQSTLSDTSGCLKPPCATLTPAPSIGIPLTSSFAIQTQFNWKTSCNHITDTAGYNINGNTYSFAFTYKDDYCPVPASVTKMINITVLPKPKLVSPIIDTVAFDMYSCNTTLEWQPIIDTLNSFIAYDFYLANSASSAYALIYSDTNINDTSFTYYTGHNPHMFIRTRSTTCNTMYSSLTSDTVTVIAVPVPSLIPPITNNISFDYSTYTANLSWQKVVDPYNIFIAYDIYHSSSLNGTYVLIDSVTNINQTTLSYHTGLIQNAFFYIKTRYLFCNNATSSSISNYYTLNLTSNNTVNSNSKFTLYQNEPNPANSFTIVRYSIDRRINGEFYLLDLNGRLIETQELISDIGLNTIHLNTAYLTEGIYYYRVVFGEYSAVRKLIIIKN